MTAVGRESQSVVVSKKEQLQTQGQRMQQYLETKKNVQRVQWLLDSKICLKIVATAGKQKWSKGTAVEGEQKCSKDATTIGE